MCHVTIMGECLGMSTSTVTLQRSNAGRLTRVSDFVELTKPRIAMLILVVVAISGYVARWGQPDLFALLHGILGTLLIAASASALTQLLEHRRDALMVRTANRPLPAGRLMGWQVAAFAAVTFIFGLAVLLLLVNWQTAAWALLTWVVYVGLYTPLKPISTWNTSVGAISGALPVFIGWTAVGGSMSREDPRGLALFFVLLLWQFPHFMAIAWIYRRQYQQAGMKMLSVVDPTGRCAGLQAVAAALALLPVSFVPVMVSSGYGSMIYLTVAFALGAGQLTLAIVFLLSRSERSARWLLTASLVYLPALFVCLVLTTLI
jgi:protoheme IX farnesyltransferase